MGQAQRTVKLLLIDSAAGDGLSPEEMFGPAVEVVSAESLDEAQAHLARQDFDYVLATPQVLRSFNSIDPVCANADLVESVNQGVAVVDGRGELVWANPRMLSFSDDVRRFVCTKCMETFSWATADPARYRTSHLTGRQSTMRRSDGAVFELTATPIIDIDHQVTQVVAVIWDVTRALQRREQLAAIDEAGRELVRLDAEQVSRLETHERLALLEQKIVRYLRELMHFDNFSIHILDKKNNKLDLVLSSGLPEEVQNIDLYALPDGNGITGYVAYHGRSYICPNVPGDSRYFKGLEGALSSLTVPLRLNDEVIGVLNVESNKRAAFDEESRQLAEIFGRDIATALHILDLLVTERFTTTGRLGSDVMAEISAPVNDILTDVENLIEDYIGHDDLRHRLNKITGNAVAIREAIKRVTSPKRGLIGRQPTGVRRTDPILTGKRILIADDEEMIRDTVRDVLTSYGCEVSLADDGAHAVELLGKEAFDLVLSDIKMPRCSGYEVFAAAKDANPDTPVILMTGFGYDPNHAIVRARRQGLAAVLFKPFKVDQLLGEIRGAIRSASS